MMGSLLASALVAALAEDREPGAGTDSVADAGTARLSGRGLSNGWNCWAEIVEDVRTAPRIVVVNAEVVRCKPRLLTFPGLALPDGSSSRECIAPGQDRARNLTRDLSGWFNHPTARMVLGAFAIPFARPSRTPSGDPQHVLSLNVTA